MTAYNLWQAHKFSHSKDIFKVLREEKNVLNTLRKNLLTADAVMLYMGCRFGFFVYILNLYLITTKLQKLNKKENKIK